VVSQFAERLGTVEVNTKPCADFSRLGLGEVDLLVAACCAYPAAVY
jgi:hypothetical protein